MNKSEHSGIDILYFFVHDLSLLEIQLDSDELILHFTSFPFEGLLKDLHGAFIFVVFKFYGSVEIENFFHEFGELLLDIFDVGLGLGFEGGVDIGHLIVFLFLK